MSPVPLYSSTMSLSMQVNMYACSESHLSSDLSLDKHVSNVSATCFYHLSSQTHPAVVWRWFGSDTRSRLRDIACLLLQWDPRRGSEDNNRQATMNVKRCCTSRQWHQAVWSGTITTDAPGVTLAGHSRASKLQAGSADPQASAQQGASVPIKLLHSSQSSSYTAASTFYAPLHVISWPYLNIVSALNVIEYIKTFRSWALSFWGAESKAK